MLDFGYEPKLGTAMRDENWKMIVSSKGVELFDLDSDIGEETNLVDVAAERAEAMQKAIETWKKQVTRQTDQDVR